MTLTKVPATIITGFLGSGKTTLVRNVLENAGGRRLAIIVNEFGDVGIDGEILKGCGDENCPEDGIVELSNGCLCCTVADEFIPALSALLDRDNPPEHILIETSGLALPKPLVQAFNWPQIASKVTVDGVISVVDGAAVAAGRFAHDPQAVARQREQDDNLDHDNPLEEVYEDQLMCADMIVLNKIDLMSSDERTQVKSQIKSAIPRTVKVVETTNGKLDVAVLLGLNASAETDLDARPSHHDAAGEHDHDDFETFVFDVPPQLEPDALVDRIRKAATTHDILRIKGFIDVTGKPMRLVIQGVGNRISHQYDRPWHANEPRTGRLVVIGQKGLDEQAIKTTVMSG